MRELKKRKITECNTEWIQNLLNINILAHAHEYCYYFSINKWLTVLCGGRGLFFGSGCVMSSNLPEQPISSRDRGKSSGPTGGKSTDRRERQFISTTATRCKCKEYNLAWHQKAHKTHWTITVRCSLQCSCWVGCHMSDLWRKTAKCWASCWWYYYTTTEKHAEILIKTVLIYISYLFCPWCYSAVLQYQ